MQARYASAEPPSNQADSSFNASEGEARSFYRWSLQLSSALARSRERLGGDLDQLLIYMAFVDDEAYRRAVPRPGDERCGLNALSVADITGIARETTRRKLRALADGGFLRQGRDGRYYLTADHADHAIYGDLRKLFLFQALS